jgi:hypothetical protein
VRRRGGGHQHIKGRYERGNGYAPDCAGRRMMGRQTRRPKKERSWSGRAMARCGRLFAIVCVVVGVVVESQRGGSSFSRGLGKAGG